MIIISRVASRQITGPLQQRRRSWIAAISLDRTANAAWVGPPLATQPTAQGRHAMATNQVISADSHFVEPPGMWAERIDRRFRDRAPHTEKNLKGREGEFFVC